MGEILNKVIRIAKIEMDNGRYKIRSADGELYSFFQFKSGTKIPTQAYDHFIGNNHGEQFGQEDVVIIGYTETQKPNKEGKMVIYKNIISMFPSDDSPQEYNVIKPSNLPPNGKSELVEEKEEKFESRQQFGKRLAVHGMINGLLAGGITLARLDMAFIEDIIALEERIERALKSPVALQQQEAEMVSGIPF